MKHVGLARSATPATQNDTAACLQTCNEERCCSFPHRQRDGTKEASDSRRDMLESEHQNEHFVRDFLTFHTSHFVASKPTFSNLKIDVSCEASVDFHHMSQNATPATNLHLVTADNAIRKNTQHDTSKVLCLPRKMTSDACHAK